VALSVPSGSAGRPQPSFQPNGSRGASRQPERPERPERRDHPDWTERTEWMDRVSAAGYPDPRTNRSSPPTPPAHASPAPRPAARARGAPAAGGRRARREPSRDLSRDPGREPGRDPVRTSGGWPSADDDPLTSKAFSRSALVDTDGRSYRVAHRSQALADRRGAALTEQTQTFSMKAQLQAHPEAPTAS